VWLFAQAPNNRRVFYVNAPGRVADSFSIPPAADGQPAGLQTPMAVARNGVVWLGINESLISIDPSDGAVSSKTLPTPPVGAPGSNLPHQSRTTDGRFAGIDALAVNSSNLVFVGREFATALQVVDPNSLTVDTIDLPPGTAMVGNGPGDLASSFDTEVVAAVLYRSAGVDVLGQLSSGVWTLSDTSCPPDAVHLRFGILVTSGVHCVTRGRMPASGVADLEPIPVSGLPDWPCAAMLDASTTLACSSAGMLALSDDTPSISLPLGEIQTGRSSGRGVQTAPEPAQWAAVRCTIFAVDSASHFWFVVQNGGGLIGVLSSSTP